VTTTDLAVRPRAEVAATPRTNRWLPLAFALLADVLAFAWLWLGPAAQVDRQVLPIALTCAVVTGIGFWRVTR
jgi:hypothetical protein